MDNLELTGTRPPSVQSNRPSSRSSNRPRSGYHKVSESSDVDELLFTSHHPRQEEVVNFKPPWSTQTARNRSEKDRQRSKPKMRPLFWAPDERNTVTSQSDRTNILKSSNRGNHDSDRLSKYRPRKYTPSFCDETLFGPRLQEPSFEAPWAEKVKKPKPFLFSPIDYAKLTREGSTLSAKYSSVGTLDGRPPSRQGRRPVTATSRPVTVESFQDVDKPNWKP